LGCRESARTKTNAREFILSQQKDVQDLGVLTWEHFIEDEVQTIWRVLWKRKWGANNQRVHRCTDYFNDEKAAWEFASKWIEAGHEIIRVDRFDVKKDLQTASLKMDDQDEQIPTLDEWLDRWEAAVEARQTSISREEAERRYYKQYPSDEPYEPYK